jgi:hypothetical protein
MNRKNALKLTLTAGLVFLAFGGWLLHLRIHPPLEEGYNLVPFLSGVLSIFIVPLLFWFKPTIIPAYLINGFSVILGTITMAHLSLVNLNSPLTLQNLLFNTMIADIALLWGKFAVGKAIFDLEFLHTDQDAAPRGRYFRYPNTGWWLVHLVGWSIVYAAGNILWK